VVDRSWPLRPERCPCDVHFVEFLRAHRIGGRSIFHFGSGEHHLVGRENSGTAPNDILAVTASRREHDAYVALVTSDPFLARHYHVLFADIYMLAPRLLPTFDLVTLFHLHEFWDAEHHRFARHDDASLVGAFLDRLSPQGLLLFYEGSDGFVRTRPLLAQLVEDGTLVAEGRFASLLLYTRGDERASTRSRVD
jgi:hypothetical protein